jgi:hypothetical protein
MTLPAQITAQSAGLFSQLASARNDSGTRQSASSAVEECGIGALETAQVLAVQGCLLLAKTARSEGPLKVALDM